MEMVHGQAWLENKEPRLVQSMYGSLWKEVIVQPNAEGFKSSYTQDFGLFGGGLPSKPARVPLDQSMEATTIHNFAGSPKAFKRVPGYGGFLPMNGGDPALLQQAEDHTQANTKNIRLFTLGQFSVHVPGTGSYYPREADNVMKANKGKAGSSSYFANLYVSSPENLAKIAKTRAENENWGGTMETKKFFTPGALQQSENGNENSEKFYKLIRPYEGMARIQRPNAVTESGYKFSCYMNKV